MVIGGSGCSTRPRRKIAWGYLWNSLDLNLCGQKRGKVALIIHPKCRVWAARPFAKLCSSCWKHYIEDITGHPGGISMRPTPMWGEGIFCLYLLTLQDRLLIWMRCFYFITVWLWKCLYVCIGVWGYHLAIPKSYTGSVLRSDSWQCLKYHMWC